MNLHFGRTPEPGPADDWTNGASTDAAEAADPTPVDPSMPLDPEPDPTSAAVPTAPSGWSDAATSADGPHYWDRLLSSERDRVRRYGRPATIVFLELTDLAELDAQWGEDVAAQTVVRIGRCVMQEIRSSDHAARIDVARFAVFLPETTEIDAINFVERVRTAIEQNLGEMAGSIHLGIGWASPTDGDLDAALEVAERRLAADLL